MKAKLRRKAPAPSETSTMIVAGNAQANSIADVFANIPAICEHFDVQYLRSIDGVADVACDLLLLQMSDGIAIAERQLRRTRHVVRFPNLHFPLLWPLNCVNRYDRPELPAFPHGRFPYGDSYVVNCVGKNTSADDILPFCTGQTWPATWPNLDRLFISEGARLTSLDTTCDVKMSSYVLKHFAKQRLFGSPNGPSIHLLAILAQRLIQRFPEKARPEISIHDIEQVLMKKGTRNFLDRVEVPVHDALAVHFNLEWHLTDTHYAYFDESVDRTQYFDRMISHSYAVKAAQESFITI
jgi:hypothetical protein